MATKSAKVGDKRKASASEGKVAKKFSGKNERPESTRKLWKNKDASDDSSDEEDGGGALSDEEDETAAPPAKKKVKQAQDDSDKQHAKPAKTFEKGAFLDPQCH